MTERLIEERVATVSAASGGRTSFSTRDAVVACCFFASGFVGLIYEISWIRMASLVFGAATYALSTVLAVFFLGWAVGSYIFGAYSRRTTRPLAVYAALEFALGVIVLLSPRAFEIADGLYGALYPHVSHSFALVSLCRFLLVVILLLPPSFLMGGTLPLLCRHYVVDERRISLTVGLLYGLNTAGAALGCSLCGFVLIPRLGVNLTLCSGAVANILIALLVWMMRLRARPVAEMQRIAADEGAATAAVTAALATPRGLRAGAVAVMYVLFFLGGAVALANQVVWSRFLSLLTRNTVHTYTLTLTVILAGIVLGSVLTCGLFDRTGRRVFHFGMIQIMTGLVVLIVLMMPADWWATTFGASGFRSRPWIIAVVLLVPAMLSGISFPLAIRIVVERPGLAGGGVGRMTAVNTLGGITGSLAAGFAGLSLLGLHHSIMITTCLSLLIGVSAWLLLEPIRTMAPRVLLAIVVFAVWLAVPRATGTRLPEDFLAEPGRLVDLREGLSSHLAVVRDLEHLVLESDRLWQGSSRKNHQIMAAHLPMLLHPAPERVIVIGVGAGQTCGRFLMYDIASLDCVDIESKLFELVRRHFDATWMDDERVRLIVEDGRNLITHTSAQYDVISIEVGQTFRPGIASFYTMDFYEQARARLRSGGLVCQFVPTSFLTPAEFRSVIATFLAVFPQAMLWYNTSELLLIGSADDAIRLRWQRMQLIQTRPELNEDLEYAYWGGPAHWLNRQEVLLGGYLCGTEGLKRMAADAPVYGDDRPLLEYTTAAHQEVAEVAVVELLRANLEPLQAAWDGVLDDETIAAAGALRRRNLDDIIASSMVAEADKRLSHGAVDDVTLKMLGDARSLNPDNRSVNFVLGKALSAMGRKDEAAFHYAETLRINPDADDAHTNLGVILLQQGDLESALHHFSTAARLKPDNADAHNNIGSVLANMGRLEEAAAAFAEAVRLKPQFAEAHYNLGALSALLGKLDVAVQQCREALRFDPAHARAHNLMGKLLAEEGNIKDATQHYQEALRLDPGLMEARRNLQKALDDRSHAE